MSDNSQLSHKELFDQESCSLFSSGSRRDVELITYKRRIYLVASFQQRRKFLLKRMTCVSIWLNKVILLRGRAHNDVFFIELYHRLSLVHYTPQRTVWIRPENAKPIPIYIYDRLKDSIWYFFKQIHVIHTELRLWTHWQMSRASITTFYW